MTKLSTSIILGAFIIAAVFGLYLTIVSPMGHAGCPFSVGASACMAPLEHLTHWQSSFVAIAAELVLIFTLVLVVVGSFGLLSADVWQYRLFKQRERIPKRPTLLQELFSQGILHRKEPQIAYAAINNLAN